MKNPEISLADLGWSERFRTGIADDVLESTPAARVSDVHRDRLIACGEFGERSLSMPTGRETTDVTVGDWVLHDPATARVTTVLERATELARSVGAGHRRQLIAANVDTLAIVTSCDTDFNAARLERYLALAHASGTLPLIVLTKADLARDAAAFRRSAQRLSPLASVIDLDARDPQDLARLHPWAGPGQTIALVGSSGVGKSTVLNGLTGTAASVGEVREDDGKGRHTTTARSLRRSVAGGWVIDTPGMRELGLVQSAEGIDAVFDDLTALFERCRYGDCTHATEPGCAVRAAIDRGELDATRLERWRKLRREDAHHSATVAEVREQDRNLGKRIRTASDAKRARRGDR